MIKDKALIIFVRKPQLGMVKTRLAATLGNEKALAIYNQLVLHTCAIATATSIDCYIFYAHEIVEIDCWQQPNHYKVLQTNGHLGQKMEAAFEYVFNLQYSNVVIIGSDCYELNSEIIIQAFKKLEANQIVIGPANDGGYYLLGMKQLYATLFYNKAWSTNLVCQQTIDNCMEQNITYSLLPTLNDVDEEKDVPLHWL